MDDLTGTLIGRYKLAGIIGRSEIACLYKAYDTRLERNVALKLIVRSRDYSSDFVSYFLKEARALAQLSHPNITKVLDFGQEQGYLYLVTEFIEGQSLAHKMGQPLDWREAAAILLPLADALDYAHERNVIHRDLKPSNILLNVENQPVISDFSVARIIEEEETREMTGTNVGLGSPFYMSPEQGKGQVVDYRADIYALGIIFYELVTGQKPFQAESGMEVVIQQVSAAAVPPRKYAPDLPEPVEKIILTALKKDPDERFQSMSEIGSAIRQVLESGKYKARAHRAARGHSRVRSTGLRLAFAAVLLLALGAGALWFSGFLNPRLTPTPQATTIDETPIPTRVDPVKTQQPSTPSATPGVPTLTPYPTATLASSPTPRPSATPTLAWQYPAYPVLVGQPLPASRVKLSPENLGRIEELARWGQPKIEMMVWSKDNRYLIAATSAGLYFYDPATFRPVLFTHAKGWLTTLAISDDGRTIATGDQTGQVRVWDITSGAEQAHFAGHTGAITSLAFSPDKTRLLSGSADRTARLWDLAQANEPILLTRHALRINAVAFASSGSFMVTTSEDFQTILWDLNGQIIKTFRSQSMNYDLALSRNDALLALALRNSTIEVWDIAAGQRINTIRDSGLVDPITTLSFSANSQIIAAGCNDGRIRVWNATSGDNLYRMPASRDPQVIDKNLDQVQKIAYSSDGTRLFSLTRGGTIITWNMLNQNRLNTGELTFLDVQDLALSPDGKHLFYQGSSDQVVHWFMNEGKSYETLTGRMARGDPFSADSLMAALVSGDKIDIYNLGATKVGRRTTLVGYLPNGWLRFLPDGKILAVSASRALSLWSINSGRQLSSQNFKYQDNCQTAYSEDKRFLASGSELGVYLEDETAAALCKNRRNPRGLDVDNALNGALLAFAQDNGQVELWKHVDGHSTPSLLPAGKGRVQAVALSPDGRLLAAGGQDGLVRLWNVETGEIIVTLDHHTAPVTGLRFASDGTFLISSAVDGSIQVWGIHQ